MNQKYHQFPPAIIAGREFCGLSITASYKEYPKQFTEHAGARRADRLRVKKPAIQPWYVLATVDGEVLDLDIHFME